MLNLKIFQNIINSKIQLSLILLFLILFFAFIIYSPTYGTCDDFFMRSIVDDTYLNTVGNSSYLMYINQYYGEFLKTLYSIFPNISWYDLMWYIFMSCSVITVSLCTFRKDDRKYNSIAFLTLFFIYTPFFIQPQFSTVSGMMMITAVVLANYFCNTKNNNRCKDILSAIGILVFMILSFLIRYQIFLCVGLLGAILSIGLFKFNRRCIATIAIVLIGFLLSIGINHLSVEELKNTPENYKAYVFNETLAELYNDTIASERDWLYTYPWHPVETRVKDFDNKLAKYGYKKGDYRLLVTWSYLGNKELFTTEKMESLAKDLAPEILIRNQSYVNFKTSKTTLVRSYIFIMALLVLMYFSRRNLLIDGGIVLSFVIYTIALNTYFRPLPYHVWINFAVLMVSMFLFYIKTSNEKFILDKSLFDNIPIDLNPKNIKNFALILLLIMFVFVGYRPIHKSQLSMNIEANEKIEKYLQTLNKEKIYLADSNLLFSSGRPFHKNPLKELKYISMPLSHFPIQEKLIDYYNLPHNDFWNYACRTDNVEVLKYSDYDNHFKQIELAVSKHMKDRYNLDVSFMPSQKIQGLTTHSCKVLNLSPEDIEQFTKYSLWLQYKNLTELENSVNYLEFR